MKYLVMHFTDILKENLLLFILILFVVLPRNEWQQFQYFSKTTVNP
jgi:hypothetical protein